MSSMNVNTQDEYIKDLDIKNIIQLAYEIIQSKNMTNPLLTECLNIAKYFLATNFDLEYKHLLMHFSKVKLQKYCKFKKKEQFFPECAALKFKDVNKATLNIILAVVSRTPHPPEADCFLEKYLTHWIFYSFCEEFGLFTKSESTIDAVVVIDSIINFVSDHTHSHSEYDAEIQNVIKTGIRSLNILIENSKVLMKEISNNSIWKLPFFNYMIKEICCLPYEKSLHLKIFACSAIKLLFMKLSVEARCIYANRFVEHLLYIIEDMTFDQYLLNIYSVSTVKSTLTLIISSIIQQRALQFCLKPCIGILLAYIASPSEIVRNEVKSHLENLSKALDMDHYAIIQPFRGLLPNLSQLNKLLTCVPLKSKIGMIDGFAFSMEFFPPLFRCDIKVPDHRKCLRKLAQLCINGLNSFNAHSKDYIYYIKLYQAVFNIFCNCCATMILNKSLDKYLMLDYYFSNLQHVQDIHHGKYLPFIFIDALQVNKYEEYVETFFSLIKKFLAKLESATFTEKLDSHIYISRTQKAFCWLQKRTVIMIEDFMDRCVKTIPNQDAKNLHLILARFLQCNPKRNLDYFYFKSLKAYNFEKKIFFISYLEHLFGDKWNESFQAIFLKSNMSLRNILYSGRETTFEGSTRSQQLSQNISLPNEEMCSAITVLYCLNKYNITPYQWKEMTRILQNVWITINDLSKNVHYDIKVVEFRQLAELLLEVFKSSRKIELLFDLLRAPIDQLSHSLNFIVDFLKNVVIERYSNEWKTRAFLIFVLNYHENKYPTDLSVKILEFLLIPALKFSMKRGIFKLSEPMIKGALICFEDLKIAKHHIKISLLRISCLILECASHNINDNFLKQLKNYVKDFQVKERYVFDLREKCYWDLFWAYLFKIDGIKLNQDLEHITKIFQNSLKSCNIVELEVSRHVLDILIPIVSLRSNWIFHCTNLTKKIVEEEILPNVNLYMVEKEQKVQVSNYDLQLEHIFSVILNHCQADDTLHMGFVSSLLKTAGMLFHSSVTVHKKIAIEVVETLFKCSKELCNEKNRTEIRKKKHAFKIFKMCGNLLIDNTRAFTRNRSSAELHRRCIKLLKNIFDLHSLEDLLNWCNKMGTLSIYNRLELLKYLLLKYQGLCFEFSVNYIDHVLNSFWDSEVPQLFEKLMKKLYEHAEVKFSNEFQNKKHFLKKFFEIIDLLLKRTVWQPHTKVFSYVPFQEFPDVMYLIILHFKKIVKSFENIVSKLLKLFSEQCFDHSADKRNILAFSKFIDSWLSNFVLSEGSKTDIVLPDVNSIKFKQFTTAFIFRCLMESLGWLIMKLVVNVYPQYLSSKEYTNILKTVLENHMKYYSAGDLTGRKQINIHETKIIMALQIIELGFIESTHWAKIIDLLLALIKKTDSKAILLIIMNIIKKLCVYVFCNSFHKKDKIRSLIQEVATRIGLKFQNDKKMCNLYFKIIEMFKLIYSNSENGTSTNRKKKFISSNTIKSEFHDNQQRFFCFLDNAIPKNICKKMLYLTAEFYWQHTTSFAFAPCVHLITSCYEEDPRVKFIHSDSMQRKKKFRKKIIHNFENKIIACFYEKCNQRTKTVLKTMESFEVDLSKMNYSSFYDALQKLFEFDDNLAKHLWNNILPKVFSILDRCDKRVVAHGIEYFVRRELIEIKERGKKHVEKIFSFADIYLRNSEPSLVTHSFFKFVRNFPGLCERSCLCLEDSFLKSSGLESSHDKVLELLIDAYLFLHEDDLLTGLLFENKILNICSSDALQIGGIANKEIKFAITADSYQMKNALGIECIREIDNWSDLRRFDKTVFFDFDNHSKIGKTFCDIKAFLMSDITSLTASCNTITKVTQLYFERWKSLSPLVLTEKHYSLLKVGKKIAEFEKALLFKILLFDFNLDNCQSNLMNLLEEWYFHTPDVNLSFWKDIFDVRLCLLQRLCFCLSEIPSKDEASIWKMKCMAKSTYITTQMYLAKMYLLQGFSEECLNQLNHIKTSIMDGQILQLYMESILLAVKQHYKDKAKVKSFLDKATHFLKLKHQNLTNNKEGIMFIIYGKVISTLQIENDVAKNAFLQPYHNITGWSIGWIFCGKYFQNIYTTRNEKRVLALAMECFVKACRYKNGSDNKELLSRILWILSYEDSSLSLSNTFISNGGEDIPISCWLPWIPQLLMTILRTSTCNLSFLLHAIGNKYPNSLFFLLHIFLKKIASKPKKRKLVKCFKQILSDLKIKYPGLCRSLKNISNEFLILSWNIHPDVHNILKKIESEICDILFQSVTKQTDVDIVSKITDVFLKRFSNMEEIRDENVEFIVKFIHRVRSEGDLHIFLYQLSKWIAHYERKKKNNKRSFPLKMQSTFLSSFHLHHEEIQMFMNSYTKPTCIQISRFLPIVEVMESNDGSAYRIFIEGSNGKVYPYIIIRNMYSENVLQEDRIFQFFSLLNSLMTIERPLYSHSLQFKIPAYVCIHPCLKMIQCDVSSYSLLDIYNQYCTEMEQKNLVIPALLEIFCALNQNKAHIPNTGIDKSYRIKIFNTIQENMVPKTIIKKKFANGSAINYMESRKKFAVDIALAGISRFLFFLNQQMPEETFINFGSGEVSTFGLKFSLLHDVDTQDTYIPFRLTKNISEFITPMGVSGYVKSTILHTVQCFNKHDDEIESFLKTLLLDEFDDLEMNIYGCSNHKKISKIIQLITQNIEEYAAENVGELLIRGLIRNAQCLDYLSSMCPSLYAWL